jgi:hypothetical protein
MMQRRSLCCPVHERPAVFTVWKTKSGRRTQHTCNTANTIDGFSSEERLYVSKHGVS